MVVFFCVDHVKKTYLFFKTCLKGDVHIQREPCHLKMMDLSIVYLDCGTHVGPAQSSSAASTTV